MSLISTSLCQKQRKPNLSPLAFLLQTLVRSLLAEQLNSSEWSSRLSACNVLSGLKGPINKVQRP